MVDGYMRKQKRRVNELIYLAWHTEIFARQKQLPELKSLLQGEDEKAKHGQTDDEMMVMCKMLNAAFGGDTVEVYGNGDI